MKESVFPFLRDGIPPKINVRLDPRVFGSSVFFEGNGGFPRVIKLPIFFGGGSNKQQIYGHFEEFPLKNDALGWVGNSS